MEDTEDQPYESTIEVGGVTRVFSRPDSKGRGPDGGASSLACGSLPPASTAPPLPGLPAHPVNEGVPGEDAGGADDAPPSPDHDEQLKSKDGPQCPTKGAAAELELCHKELLRLKGTQGDS